MAALDYALYSELAVGANHPTLLDVVNRPLKSLVLASGLTIDVDPFPGFLALTGGTRTVIDNTTFDGDVVITGTLTVGGGSTFDTEYGKIAGPEVTGTNAVGVTQVSRGARGTGNSTPAGVTIEVPIQGVSGAALQTYSEGFRVQEVANASAREIAAWNVNGPVIGGLPLNVNNTLLSSGDGGRFSSRVRTIRSGLVAAFVGTRVNTSLNLPSQVLINDDVVGLYAEVYTNISTVAQVGSFSFFMRENAVSTALGSGAAIRVTDIGSATPKTVVQLRGGGANIAEFLATQNTFRFIPSTTGYAFRDSGNTADTFSINAAGTTILAPLATSFVIGTDTGGGNLVRVGGSIRTTNLFLSQNFAAIASTADTTAIGIYGGSVVNTGGSIRVFGPSHASQANDVEIRSNTTVVATWDDSVTSWLYPTTTAFVIGTDPGTSALLRIGGAMVVQNITISGGNIITRSTSTDVLSIYGGSINGGNVRFYGSGHATQANDIELRSGATVIAQWDDSATSWLHPTTTSFIIGTDPGGSETLRVGGQVRAASYVNTGGVFARSNTGTSNILTGDSSSTNGGRIVVYGSTHATQAFDIEFARATSIKGWWDDSDTQWTFSDKFYSVVASGADATGNFTTENQFVIAHNSGLNSLGLYRGSADNGGAALVGYKSRSATLSTRSAVNSGDTIFSITAQGASTASQSLNGAQIRFEATGLWSNNNAPTKIIFAVNTGAASPQDRWEIGAGGTFIPTLDATNSFGSTTNQILNGFFSGTVRAEQYNLLAANPYLKQDTGTNANFVQIFGGAISNGGSVKVYGGSHSSKASDIEFIRATTILGGWDDSAAQWNFGDTTRTLIRASNPAAGETGLWLYDADNATLERVTVGAADSGGAGFKVLRIPN